MSASLSWKDQRAKGDLYLQGLMLEGASKSMLPMGERLGLHHQQLQQFVSSLLWAVEPLRRVPADEAIELIALATLVIDDTGLVKDGPASPGAARQYSGTVGKVADLQIYGQANFRLVRYADDWCLMIRELTSGQYV